MRLSRSLSALLAKSRLLQAALVVGIWLAGEALVRVLGIPLPGGVIGLALMLVLLATHRLETGSVRRGAEWLLADMLLFFIPVALAVVDHRELLGFTGLKILFVILASTAAVMIATALAVDRCFRWRAAHVRDATPSR